MKFLNFNRKLFKRKSELRTISESNQISVLKWMLRILKIIGGYSEKLNVLSYFTLISVLLLVLHQLIDLSLWNGMETLKRIKFLPSSIICFIKVVSLMIYRRELIALIKMIKHFWRADAFELTTTLEMYKVYNFLSLVCGGYFFSCICLCGVLAIKPFGEHEQVMLILTDFALCDLRTAWCFWSNYAWQIYLVAFQVVPAALVFDCLFIIFTGYIYVGCQLFAIGIRKLNTHDACKRQAFLRVAVDQQDLLMGFVNLVDDMFSVVMLLQFWCSLWSMIMFLYMIVADGLPPPKIDDAIFYFSIYVIFVYQIFLYSFGGAIIENQIRGLATSVFIGVDWFDQGRTSLRKDLALMIFRAQNAKILSVGKMSDLNLMLWVTTMKNSLSVFTLIMQISGSDDLKL